MPTHSNSLTRIILALMIGLSSSIVIAAQESKEQAAPRPPRVFGGPPRVDRNREPSREPVLIMSPVTRMRWVSEFEPDSEEKRLLLVDPSDEAAFSHILAQPRTGIIRLLPLSSQERVVSAAEAEAYRRPGFTYFAATYSFSKRKHGNCLNGWQGSPRQGWAELRLKEGILGTAIMEDSIGLMVRLGDIPLENVMLQTAGVAELDGFTPPADHVGAKNIYENGLRGIKVGPLTFSSRIPANLNTTYALRSAMRRRADVLIAFRVVRKDADGGITLVWKKLKEYRKPSWKKKDHR